MATKENFYIDNILVEPPENAPDLSIQFNFDSDAAEAKKSISLTDVQLVRENADNAIKYYNDGNIFVGQLFRYEVARRGLIEVPFNGYFDYTKNATLSPIRCKLTAQEYYHIDWLNDVADSVSFEYMFVNEEFTSSLFLYQPYIISTLPNYQEAFISTLSTVVISIQLGEQVEQLIELASSTVSPFEYSFIIRAALRVIYIVGLVITLVSLIKDIVNLLIQPVKYHACMRVKDLFEIGCKHFGLTLRTSIFDDEYKDLVILPEKLFISPSTGDDRLLGFANPDPQNQTGYPRMTFGEFLRQMKTVFKAKVIITNDAELLFVREDFSPYPPQYVLHQSKLTSDLYNPDFTTNADQLKANYYIKFLTDLNDKNTILEYTGTAYQVITTQINDVLQPLNLIKGLETVTVPYAQAKMKTSLTSIELVVDAFFQLIKPILKALRDAIDAIIDVVNDVIDVISDLLNVLDDISFGLIDLSIKKDPIPHLPEVDLPNIENRLGMLKIENDFISVPKLYVMQVGSQSKFNKISGSNSTVVSAKYLWNNYHGPVVSFLPSVDRPNGNQYLIKQYDKVPFTFDDFEKIKTNNHCFSNGGKDSIIDSGEWNVRNEQAKIKIRISHLYTNKLKETYLEPNGS